MTRRDDRGRRESCRRRLEVELPTLLTLQTRARQHVAALTRGVSERVEALGQHLACVRMKADRIQHARGSELEELLAEFEAGWEEVERCAAGIRAVLERSGRRGEPPGG